MWKLSSEQQHLLDIISEKIPRNKDSLSFNCDLKSINNLCDLSLLSFLKIISKINRKIEILKYRNNEALNKRIPNYKVKMGFGLHLGWAIEGGIGSDLKIDASYLSPNVNLASRLEAATKQFGVNILVSENLFIFFSEKIQKLCRKIDKVTLKGSKQPISLYTVDMNTENLVPSCSKKTERLELKKVHLLKKIGIATGLQNNSFNIEEFLLYDKDLSAIVEQFNQEFQTFFARGVKSYLDGFWKDAKKILSKISFINKKEDGPSKALLEFMKSYNYVCPKNWTGFRELTEK